MPLRYWVHCERCDYRAYRYRNVQRCPDCRGKLAREDVPSHVGQERDAKVAD